MITLRGHILVSRTDDDTPSHSSRVYVQNVPVCTGITRTCVSTCGRGAGIHGDVLNVHTEACCIYTRGVFSVPHHTTHTTTTITATITATHNNDNDTQQPPRQRHTTTTTTTTHNDTQPTNLQLHLTQHGKTHQVQTQQRLTDSSFFIFSVVLHGRFLRC